MDVNYGGSTGMLSEFEQFILLTSIILGSGQTFHLLFIVIQFCCILFTAYKISKFMLYFSPLSLVTLHSINI